MYVTTLIIKGRDTMLCRTRIAQAFDGHGHYDILSEPQALRSREETSCRIATTYDPTYVLTHWQFTNVDRPAPFSEGSLVMFTVRKPKHLQNRSNA